MTDAKAPPMTKLSELKKRLRYSEGGTRSWWALGSAAAATIEKLERENAELGRQRLMILAAVYPEAPRFVATICNESLDRSGALLGQVRELARASLSPSVEKGE